MSSWLGRFFQERNQIWKRSRNQMRKYHIPLTVHTCTWTAHVHTGKCSNCFCLSVCDAVTWTHLGPIATSMLNKISSNSSLTDVCYTLPQFHHLSAYEGSSILEWASFFYNLHMCKPSLASSYSEGYASSVLILCTLLVRFMANRIV